MYMRRKDDGDYLIRKLDGTEWGYKRRRLRVEWAKVGAPLLPGWRWLL